MNSKLRRDVLAVCYRHTIWKILPTLGIALSWTQGHAADICVLAGDYVGLQMALHTSEQNAENDLIMLQSGTYDIPSNNSVIYNPTDPHDLTIAGGYEEFEGDPCGGIISHDARQTVLNGGNLFFLGLPDGTGSITLSTLSVTGVLTTNPAYAIQILGPPSSTGSVHVTNSIFAGNISFGASAIYILGANSVLIENSLFYENGTLSGSPTIQIGVIRPSAGLCMGVVHSTFTQNTSATQNVKIWSNTCGTVLGNDIFWGNGGGDLQLASSPTYAWNVDVGDLNDLANATTSQAMSQNPLFNPDFSLKDFSPLRDAGLVGGFLFANGEYDAFGNPRIYGANPDIGAFEISDVIFAHGFDWSPSPALPVQP